MWATSSQKNEIQKVNFLKLITKHSMYEWVLKVISKWKPEDSKWSVTGVIMMNKKYE